MDSEDEPVEFPISNVLDLHSFAPRETKTAVEEWLREVKLRGWTALRIVHGRGIGAQREMVRKLLDRDPDVVSFGDAPAEAGGWGATLVTLRQKV